MKKGEVVKGIESMVDFAIEKYARVCGLCIFFYICR